MSGDILLTFCHFSITLKLAMYFFLKVSLQVRKGHECGGVLYNSSTVITAGHCCMKVLNLFSLLLTLLTKKLQC